VSLYMTWSWISVVLVVFALLVMYAPEEAPRG
jgi:hypothetical protein